MSTKSVVRILFVLIGCGLVVCCAIIAAALRPERGAKMILMALPLVAQPLALCGAVLVGVAGWRGNTLSRRERTFAFASGGLILVLFASLLLLG